MTKQSTEMVPLQQEFDVKGEAKKQLQIAVFDSLQCARKPAKDFLGHLVDCSLNRLSSWVSDKLSA